MPRPLTAAAAVLLCCAPVLAQQPTAGDGPAALRHATELFQQAKADPKNLTLAAMLFKLAFAEKVPMTADQTAAWAFCRVKLAHDRFARTGDPAVADEVAEALKLAPDHAGLQRAGADLIAQAKAKASGGRQSPGAATGNDTPPAAESTGRLTPAARQDGSSFAVTGPSAAAVSQKAEEHRAAIFERWSGPPAGPWAVPCQVVVHPDAAAFAAATGQSPEHTGRATVTLDGGRVTARRIDLRADDPTLLDDALPRELTHVVLADLFPYRAPPAWAEAGMAVLATSPTERDRYRRTLPKSYQGRELIPLAALFDLPAPPADRATGFYVGSASVVEFLVKWKGERVFKGFLSEAQRYGAAASLKKTYGFADVAALEKAWVQAELAGARAQAP
jgi:hypothetical protein